MLPHFGATQRIVGGEAAGTPADIAALGRMLADGTLRAVIDRRYPMAQAADAHAYVDSMRKRGAVVLNIGV